MPWYYANNNQRQGPVSDMEFSRLVREKIVRDETLVWRHGMADWKSYADVEPTLQPPDIPEGAASELREPAADAENLQVGDGLVKPVSRLAYAGFSVRLAAKLVDWMILWLLAKQLARLMGLGDLNPFDLLQAPPEVIQPIIGRIMLVSFMDGVMRLCFYWYFLRRYAATPGKLLFGLRVISTRGGALTNGQIVGRFFSEVLAKYFTLCIGYVVAAFDQEKRTMQDHFCDTRVIRKNRD